MTDCPPTYPEVKVDEEDASGVSLKWLERNRRLDRFSLLFSLHKKSGKK